jgi:hypothetical protein
VTWCLHNGKLVRWTPHLTWTEDDILVRIRGWLAEVEADLASEPRRREWAN